MTSKTTAAAIATIATIGCVTALAMALQVRRSARSVVAASPAVPVVARARQSAFRGSPRCAVIAGQPTGPAAPDARRTESDLYAAIVTLRTAPRSLPVLVVESTSLPIPPLRLTDDQGFLDALPADLRSRVREGVPECGPLGADRFPDGTRLLSLAEIRGEPARGRADWPAFTARFEGVHMWFAFSRALVSGEGRDAVVFYERPCDGRCGEAEWVWFHRTGADQPWRVMKELWSWIS